MGRLMFLLLIAFASMGMLIAAAILQPTGEADPWVPLDQLPFPTTPAMACAGELRPIPTPPSGWGVDCPASAMRIVYTDDRVGTPQRAYGALQIHQAQEGAHPGTLFIDYSLWIYATPAQAAEAAARWIEASARDYPGIQWTEGADGIWGRARWEEGSQVRVTTHLWQGVAHRGNRLVALTLQAGPPPLRPEAVARWQESLPMSPIALEPTSQTLAWAEQAFQETFRLLTTRFLGP